jgi:predicted nucleic acid-binding protein
VSKLFVDTNLFVYALDQKEPSKKEKARVVLKKVTDEHCIPVPK